MKRQMTHAKLRCKSAPSAAGQKPVRGVFEPGERMTHLPVRNKSPRVVESGMFPCHAGIERCLNFMANNFYQPIQLKDVIRISGLQRRGFIKAFVKHTGASPGAVLRHSRIEYAKRILAERDLKLTEIARQCGYKSKNTFCVAFQNATGLSPKKFQRMYWLAISQNHRKSHAHSGVAKSILQSLDKMTPTRFKNSKMLATKIIYLTAA